MQFDTSLKKSENLLKKSKSNDKNSKGKNFQDSFLNTLRNSNKEINILLTNGSEIRGKLISFDQYVVILEKDNKKVMIYKHAISKINEI
ncbi:MAG: RNA chaperone Hfq [bacterium]|nr:RNA chaperone Hfq [bacterium]